MIRLRPRLLALQQSVRVEVEGPDLTPLQPDRLDHACQGHGYG